MAQSGKGRLNYRCPSCFMRDLDIDMFYDKDRKEYYCIRCQYVGTEEDVLAQEKKDSLSATEASAAPDSAAAAPESPAEHPAAQPAHPSDSTTADKDSIA